MSIDVLLRLLRQQLVWFLLLPLVTAATAWYATRNSPKVYTSQATLYTGLATGYSLVSDQQSQFVDRSTTAFDNLLATLTSRETLLQVGIGLLTDHLRLPSPDTMNLGGVAFRQLQRTLPASFRASLPLGDSLQLATALDSLLKVPGNNPVKALLLTSPDSYYSLQRLGSTLKGSPRKATNDVMLLEYEANEPAVARQTLVQAITVLKRRYSGLKSAETNSVLAYYQTQLKKAKQTLDAADAALKAFSVQHGLLNFDEEARTMAASRESMQNDYSQELMRQGAAKAAIETLTKQMGQQGGVRQANNDLSDRQRKLSNAEAQLANAQAYGQPKAAIAKLQAAVNQAADELKASALQYSTATTSPESVPQQTLVNDWLTKKLEYEESTARLVEYRRRLNEFGAKAQSYTPLAAQLRQLTRNMTVAESEYLAVLQHVDQSRTRQQDVNIGGSLEVLDAPNFPLVPLSSKRGQLIAIGFGLGIFLALLFTALRFWLDKRLYSPDQAEATIGHAPMALFPTVRKPLVFSKVTRAARSMFEQLFNTVNVEIAQTIERSYPAMVTVFSIRAGQGKSWTANGLLRLYAIAGQQVAYCYPRTTGQEKRDDREGITYLPYTVRPDLMNVTDLTYLLDADDSTRLNQYDLILLELPALINHQIPTYLLKMSNLSLLIVDSNSGWGRTEKQLLALYERATSQPILPVLNHVGMNYIDKPRRRDSRPASTPPSAEPQPGSAISNRIA